MIDNLNMNLQLEKTEGCTFTGQSVKKQAIIIDTLVYNIYAIMLAAASPALQ